MNDVKIKFCQDATSRITVSKTVMKISVALLALFVFVGVSLQNSTKGIESVLESSKLQFVFEKEKLETVIATTGSSNNATTLALLYPPGIIGGYRNQVLRLIAFVVHAKEQKITQILLPSLLWTTRMMDPGFNSYNNSNDRHSNDQEFQQKDFPIPFDWVFDVDHWNTFAEHLPILVTPDQMRPNMDCWLSSSETSRGMDPAPNATRHVATNTPLNVSNTFYYRYDRPTASHSGTNDSSHPIYVNHLQRAALLQGTIRPIANNVTIPMLTNQLTINVRQHNYAPETDHCRNPRVHGGGRMSGVLWNAYLSYIKRSAALPGRTNTSIVPYDTDVWIYRALRPAGIWRTVAQECIQAHAPTGKYMALHARVELDMMQHLCGSGMEKNLSKIVDQVYQLYDDQPESFKSSISALFIAVSRDGMKITSKFQKNQFYTVAMENLQTLNRITQNASVESGSMPLPAFECGEKILQQFYAKNPNIPNHGTLLQSVINFYTAVSSEIFIGVAQSSYSTDILTTRYWLGKGASNYRYTANGIESVENGGLPVPHGHCENRSGRKRPTSFGSN